MCSVLVSVCVSVCVCVLVDEGWSVKMWYVGEEVSSTI